MTDYTGMRVKLLRGNVSDVSLPAVVCVYDGNLTDGLYIIKSAYDPVEMHLEAMEEWHGSARAAADDT